MNTVTKSVPFPPAPVSPMINTFVFVGNPDNYPILTEWSQRSVTMPWAVADRAPQLVRQRLESAIGDCAYIYVGGHGIIAKSWITGCAEPAGPRTRWINADVAQASRQVPLRVERWLDSAISMATLKRLCPDSHFCKVNGRGTNFLLNDADAAAIEAHWNRVTLG